MTLAQFCHVLQEIPLVQTDPSTENEIKKQTNHFLALHARKNGMHAGKMGIELGYEMKESPFLMQSGVSFWDLFLQKTVGAACSRST